MKKNARIMMVAGEASGDHHAANLYRELRQRHPGIRAFGMGGADMREAGVDLLYDSTDIAVIGIGEILRHYGEIRRALKQMQQAVCEQKPDLLICVDYKEFNLKLAEHARRCGVKVLFYVSPQVWAWRPGRVRKYGRAVDMMAVIFPFEVPFYEEHRIPVRYVGHPLAGKVRASVSAQEFRTELGLDGDSPLIGLLPGSRGNEIKRLLPLMLEAAAQIRQRHPRASFVLPQASSVSDGQLEPYLRDSPVDVIRVRKRTYDAINACDAVLTSSGTATLEIALLGVPMVITYKVSPLSYAIMSRLIRIPDIGLANIVAGHRVVQEYVQDAATPQALANEIDRLLDDETYAQGVRGELQRVRRLIGEENGTDKLADVVEEMLTGD